MNLALMSKTLCGEEVWGGIEWSSLGAQIPSRRYRTVSIAVKMRRRGNLEMTREVLEDSIVKMWQQMRKVPVGEMGLTRLWNLLRDSKDRLSDVAGCAQNVAAPPLEVGLRTGFSLRCR